MRTYRVLLVDDDAAIRASLRMMLEYDGYDCLDAASGPEALDRVAQDAPDLVLLDVKMPGMDGLEVLQRIRATQEHLPVVVVSGHGTVSTAVEATRRGAFDFLEKPLTTERVLLTLRRALEDQAVRDENRGWRQAAEERHRIIGDSPTLSPVLDAIRRAAPTTATVLIQGESGVGKELVARAIHRNSLRYRERFVQVNCAAIPEELIESELFGHEKGAFTGATERQVGKFEQADRGTIFLDEVGDMSPRTQAKVLRVLQEGEVERLGSARTSKVDVRVIAATNKSLDEEIAAGRFREDLYFRLAVIPIIVPPLRERPDDIPRLVQHFLRQFRVDRAGHQLRVSDAAMDALVRHRWRGNIRELRNTCERLAIMVRGDVIERSDLPADVTQSGYQTAATGDGAPTSLKAFKDAVERRFLVEQLRACGWNISKTADVIDTPRSNLYKKLEQYGISQEHDGE